MRHFCTCKLPSTLPYLSLWLTCQFCHGSQRAGIFHVLHTSCLNQSLLNNWAQCLLCMVFVIFSCHKKITQSHNSSFQCNEQQRCVKMKQHKLMPPALLLMIPLAFLCWIYSEFCEQMRDSTTVQMGAFKHKLKLADTILSWSTEISSHLICTSFSHSIGLNVTVWYHWFNIIYTLLFSSSWT